MTVPAPFAGYDRTVLRPTVVHIGPGVFHRAHQAVYADTVLRTGAAEGAIWGLSLRSAGVRDALAPAGFLYHVVERAARTDPVDDAPVAVRRIGALLGIDVAAQDVEAALARLVDSAVTVVTTTVTEHGYCAVRPGGSLDTARPEIVHDLRAPHAPQSLPGLVLEALVRRRAAGTGPFTVACCDNLPSNGAATARVVTELAACHDASLAEWLVGNVAFPSSMVDRMVPATSDEDRAFVRRLGIADAWPVVTEPFSQWVLEDTFPAGRPPWERAGVELVTDVAAHEQAKLRILNAAHSALAYWGLLAGHRYVWEAAGDPVLRAAAAELLADEVLPTLEPPRGWDLTSYARRVLDRFANPALPYTTAKVAADGSQKLTVRLVPTVVARLARREPAPRCAQVLAAWAVCVAGPRAPEIAVGDAALALARASSPSLPANDGSASPDRATEALLALPGFLDATSDVQRRYGAEVARHARALWAGDVRVVLQSPRPLGPGPGDHLGERREGHR